MKLKIRLLICLLGFATANPAIADKSVPTEPMLMEASWYGPGLQGNTMKNGEPFDMNDPTIVAHKTFPMGTKLLLSNPETGRYLVVIVQDRGPFVRGRDLDLSKAAAQALGFYCGPHCGAATLTVLRLN